MTNVTLVRLVSVRSWTTTSTILRKTSAVLTRQQGPLSHYALSTVSPYTTLASASGTGVLPGRPRCNQPDVNKQQQRNLRKTSFYDILEEDGKKITLFNRDPARHPTIFIQSGLGFACLHTLYWVWYNVDFIPSVNATLTDAFIDPMVGLFGLTFASVAQFVAVMYTRCLVSRIEYDPVKKRVLLYNYKAFPLYRPAFDKPVLNVPVGQLSLDPSAPEVTNLLDKLGGDLSSVKGRMPISCAGVPEVKWKNPPYVLHVESELDVPQPYLMLDALMYPDVLLGKKKKIGKIKAPVRGPATTRRRR